MPTQCSICNHEDRLELEAIGKAALDGNLSWRAAGREGARFGLTHEKSLKNHMVEHWTSPVETLQAEVNDELAIEMAATERELLERLRLAPPEVKPLFLAAIHNMRKLFETKPSQQHLINSLKTIQEITGMKAEQQFLLDFGQQMFGKAEKVEVERRDAALAELDVVDAELVES